MSKKEICMENKSFAYWSGLGGLELKTIEYDIEDYIYCVSDSWTAKPKYHKLKVYYTGTDSYIRLYGYKIMLSDCIMM